MEKLTMWYEYDYTLTNADNTEATGHYETENKKEIIKRLITTFSDVLNGIATAKMLENKVIEGQQFCNIYVKYKDGSMVAKFGNVPIAWGGQIDATRIDL